jgi:hypothetical protein
MQHCRVSFADLIDFQEERADAATIKEIEQHLKRGCDACRRRQTYLQRMLIALNGRELRDAPASAYIRLRAAYRERFAAGPARPPLIARPVFDSRMRATLAGARGGVDDTFQIIHSTVEHDIHLWAEKQSGQAWYLIGQVLPHAGGDSISPEVAMLQAADGVGIPAETDSGEFHLPAVASGNYTLRLRLPAGEVVVPDVAVGL